MNQELNDRIIIYRLALASYKKLLDLGVISKPDYLEIETIIAKECGLNSSTIFTDITGYI